MERVQRLTPLQLLSGENIAPLRLRSFIVAHFPIITAEFRK